MRPLRVKTPRSSGAFGAAPQPFLHSSVCSRSAKPRHGTQSHELEGARSQCAVRPQYRDKTGGLGVVQWGLSGGGSGIRTRDTVSRIHTFQACAFNHSATPPIRPGGKAPGRNFRVFIAARRASARRSLPLSQIFHARLQNRDLQSPAKPPPALLSGRFRRWTPPPARPCRWSARPGR